MKKYKKIIKLFGKKWQVKEKSLAYYFIEYFLPTLATLGVIAILWGLYVMLYYILLPYSTMA